MNYVANREVTKKRVEKIFAVYADFKSAFDKIDRHEPNEMIIRKE